MYAAAEHAFEVLYKGVRVVWLVKAQYVLRAHTTAPRCVSEENLKNA